MLNSRLIPYKKGYKISGTDIVIRKRPDVQNWEACIYIKGARKYKCFSTHTTNLDEAIIFAITKDTELKFMQKHDIDIFPNKFSKIADEWVKRLEERAITGSQSKSVLRTYKSVLRSHMVPYFGEKSIGELSVDVIQAYIPYIMDRGVKTISAMAHHNMTFKSIMKFAQEKGYYKKMSIPKLDVPKYNIEEGENRARFTDEEVEIITDKARFNAYFAKATKPQNVYHIKTMWALIHFMLATGCRTNDILQVKWSDFEVRQKGKPRRKIVDMSESEIRELASDGDIMFDDEYIFLHVFLEGKNHRRWVPIEPDYIEEFIWWRENAKFKEPDDLVFTTFDKKPCGCQSKWLKPYLKALNIPDKVDEGVRTPYSFRHTFITKKLVKGKNVFDVANQCGTSVTHIQETYCQMLPEELFSRIFGKDDKEILGEMQKRRKEMGITDGTQALGAFWGKVAELEKKEKKGTCKIGS